MCPPSALRFRAATLLVAVAAWLVGVNLCCQAAERPEQPVASCHHHPAGDHGAPDGDNHAASCGCDSVKVFTAQVASADLMPVLAPAAAAPVFYFTWAGLRLPAPAEISIRPQNTGPPGRTSFAERVLQRSLPGRAPPSLA